MPKNRQTVQKVTVENKSHVGTITQVMRFTVPAIVIVAVSLIALVTVSGYDIRTLLEGPPSGSVKRITALESPRIIKASTETLSGITSAETPSGNTRAATPSGTTSVEIPLDSTGRDPLYHGLSPDSGLAAKCYPFPTSRTLPPIDETESASDSHGLVVTTIYQGKSSDESNLIFDLILTNNSDTQKILIAFEKRWCYRHGMAESTDRGGPLEPIAEYIIQIPIDTDDSRVRIGSDIIYPALVIPRRDQSGPSKTSIRAQLHYYFDGRLDYHPCFDWDIFFDLYIIDDSGKKTIVFADQSWRSLIYHSEGQNWLGASPPEGRR